MIRSGRGPVPNKSAAEDKKAPLGHAGTERALRSLYGSGPGAGWPVNLMHARMAAFYGSEPESKMFA